jgi:AmmeMemoRadiSam system protein B
LIEYRAMPYRPSSHAGRSYSEDAATLSGELNGFFTGADGPGIPEFFSDSRRPVGLVAPHIDVQAGGRCFAQAYHALASGKPSDTYVIFGTGHGGVEKVFTATGLDFRTPLGTAEADKEFLGDLAAEYGEDPAAEELLHINEHVIEFQVIFLQQMFSGRHRFTIVPILCALSHHIFQDGHGFEEQRRTFERFCKAISEVCRRRSRSVCFIASADLDHIGPRYGDTFVPHRGTISDALEKDRALLSSLERLDVQGFIQGVTKDNDARRICGFSPITAMMHCMNASEGRLLALDYAEVDNRNSFVSFTSMIFYE